MQMEQRVRNSNRIAHPQQPSEQEGFIIDPHQKPKSSEPGKSKPKWFTVCRNIINGIVLAINALVAAGLVFTAYAERIPPNDWPPAVAVTMTLPAWVVAATLLLILDVLWWKRTAMLMGVAMLLCTVQITEFCPLNFPHIGMSEKEKDNSFTLMTYNVYCFQEYDKKDYGYSRQITYILKENPDVVCIQEAEFLKPTDSNKIQLEQLDSLFNRYPYYLTSGRNFAILSRFPTESINLNFPAKDFTSGDIAGWRLHIKERVVNLFSVHLRSLSLTAEDKNAYSEIVKLDSISHQLIFDARFEILPKIENAGIERAKQIDYLQKYINRYGGENAIVCGDFNDPVGSYPLYALETECKMKQAYAETGFGPMITYYPYHLYFRIDHVLYRGKLWPYSMRRGNITASDHYPLTTTFILR